jgi:hypothetical protein
MESIQRIPAVSEKASGLTFSDFSVVETKKK